MNDTVCIIGSGIGGLGLAALLAKQGYQVIVLEKNESIGGKASVFSEKGYTFDMGPSWYLMPEVFDRFFSLLGKSTSDCLDLTLLDPSYRVFFKDTELVFDLRKGVEENRHVFETLEPGSFEKFKQYLKKSEIQYEIAMRDFVYKDHHKLTDFLSWNMLVQGVRLSVFTNMQRYVERYFKTPEVQKIVQYTLVFLGSSPYNTPALYSIMSHIDFNLGVYYPQGGIHTIITSLASLAEEHGARIRVDSEVEKIVVKNNRAKGVLLKNGEYIEASIVVSNADYHHTETKLLDQEYRSHTKEYWDTRVASPSAFMMYLGVDGAADSLLHHTLLFSTDWKKNFAEIFDFPQIPTDPSLYICAPSKTDSSVAPTGKENMFVLVPMAPGLTLTPDDELLFADKTLAVLEKSLNIVDLKKRIEYQRIFSTKDFESRYHSFKGSALGLAHTLFQTALWRPRNMSKKVSGLFFVGADTEPGIGMPMCLISAELVAKRITQR